MPLNVNGFFISSNVNDPTSRNGKAGNSNYQAEEQIAVAFAAIRSTVQIMRKLFKQYIFLSSLKSWLTKKIPNLSASDLLQRTKSVFQRH